MFFTVATRGLFLHIATRTRGAVHPRCMFFFCCNKTAISYKRLFFPHCNKQSSRGVCFFLVATKPQLVTKGFFLHFATRTRGAVHPRCMFFKKVFGCKKTSISYRRPFLHIATRTRGTLQRVSGLRQRS